jgi:hypothetical protein
LLLIADPPVNDERWELVKRITASPHFQKSARLRDFLLYVSHRTVIDRSEEITVQQIGHKVFGRRPDYNPREDNIVRVEASQLRKRLETYFAEEGLNEPIVLAIPKGSYVPIFERRGATVPAKAPPAPRLQSYIQVTVIILLAAVTILLWRQNRELAGKRSSPAQSAAHGPLWSELFDESHETYIVVADAGLVAAQSLIHRPIPLKEYYSQFARRGQTTDAPGNSDPLLGLISREPLTSLADAKITGKIMQLNAQHPGRISVRSARTLQVMDLKNKNVILLGSTRSNPWGEMFEERLNFRFAFDEQANLPFFVNTAPKANEQKIYRPGAAGQKSEATYGLLALVPNLSRDGKVLIIAGAHMEGTEAAGEFATGPEFSTRTVQELALLDGRGRLRSFEILLKSRMMGGTSQHPEIVASRVLPD